MSVNPPEALFSLIKHFPAPWTVSVSSRYDLLLSLHKTTDWIQQKHALCALLLSAAAAFPCVCFPLITNNKKGNLCLSKTFNSAFESNLDAVTLLRVLRYFPFKKTNQKCAEKHTRRWKTATPN